MEKLELLLILLTLSLACEKGRKLFLLAFPPPSFRGPPPRFFPLELFPPRSPPWPKNNFHHRVWDFSRRPPSGLSPWVHKTSGAHPLSVRFPPPPLLGRRRKHLSLSPFFTRAEGREQVQIFCRTSDTGEGGGKDERDGDNPTLGRSLQEVFFFAKGNFCCKCIEGKKNPKVL